MKNKAPLLLILFSVAINRLCSAFPESISFDPFPFYDIVDRTTGENIGITLQSYVYFISNHLSVIAVWFFISYVLDDTYQLFKKFRIIEYFSLADFLVIYEHPWMYIGTYGVEFTDIQIISYTTLIILWKRQKY